MIELMLIIMVIAAILLGVGVAIVKNVKKVELFSYLILMKTDQSKVLNWVFNKT